MSSRSKSGMFKPKQCLISHIDYTLMELLSFKISYQQFPQWCQAMPDEYSALQRQHTWTLVLRLVDRKYCGIKMGL